MEHFITVEENPFHSKPCISKVHVGLTRNAKPEAYKPVLVSIGPYHKDDENLEAMQRTKEEYLKLLLERRRNDRRENYISELKKSEVKARECYVSPMSTNTIDEFTEMMLLDGCFVVEFLRKMDNDVCVRFENEDPLLNVPWMGNQILSDMILLENQLPYFVLSEVYNMTKSEREKSLEEMIFSCFNILLPRPLLKIPSNVVGNNARKINHLLHLVHLLCRPFPQETTKSRTDSEISVQTTCLSSFTKICGIGDSLDDQTRCPLLPPNQNSDSRNIDKSIGILRAQMGTVIELQEAGIKFEKVGEIYDVGSKKKETKNDFVSLFDIEWKIPSVSLFDIKFEGGVMKIPCFKVDDFTETLLRNLIAYEQHFYTDFSHDGHTSTYFTDFAVLMNQLINSMEDTKILRFRKIIMNLLGDDMELSELFNRLTDAVCESPEPYYDGVHKKVDKHCKEEFNTMIANVRRKYFSINQPWALVSAIAATILLLLTLGQFVLALISLLV